MDAKITEQKVFTLELEMRVDEVIGVMNEINGLDANTVIPFLKDIARRCAQFLDYRAQVKHTETTSFESKRAGVASNFNNLNNLVGQPYRFGGL